MFIYTLKHFLVYDTLFIVYMSWCMYNAMFVSICVYAWQVLLLIETAIHVNDKIAKLSQSMCMCLCYDSHISGTSYIAVSLTLADAALE